MNYSRTPRKIPEKKQTAKKSESNKKSTGAKVDQSTDVIDAVKMQETVAEQMQKVALNRMGKKESQTQKKETKVQSNGVSKAFTAGGKTVHLRMPNETVNPIKIENKRYYSPVLDCIMTSARDVRSHLLFGDVKSTINEIVKDYSFNPFEYQKENVEIILNNCDGRGVLGDEVGLGKTIEALMTAHVMFKKGTIRNALIIAPHRTAEGWVDEIEKKFKGVFYLDKTALRGDLNNSDKRTAFLKTLKRINGDNSKNDLSDTASAYRVYIVTDKMFESAMAEINIARGICRHIEKFYNTPISENDKKELDSIEEGLMSCDIMKPTFAFLDILKAKGYRPEEASTDLIGYDSDDEIFGVLNKWTLTKAIGDRILAILNKAHDKYARVYDSMRYHDPRVDNNMKCVTSAIDHFTKIITESDSEKEQYKDAIEVYGKLFMSGSDRLVDLLIVDEIHSFYDDRRRNVNEDGNEDDLVIDYDEQLRNSVRLLSRINKKFCILISATPLRTSLENVFDLVYIADKTRLGATATSENWYIDDENEDGEFESARNFFYNVICHTKDEEFGLIKMFFGNDDFKTVGKDSIRDFFGLIDNFFTRDRISDVSGSMHGDKRNKEAMAFIESKSKEIIKQRALMYMQTNMIRSAAESLATQRYTDWKNGKLVKGGSISHMNAAIDTVIIDEINKTDRSTSIQKQRKLHSMVDWSKGKKMGIALDTSSVLSDFTSYERKLLDRVGNIVPILLTCTSFLGDTQIPSLKERLANISNCFIYTDDWDSKLSDKDRVDKIWKIIDDYRNDLFYNTVLCYAEGDERIRKRVGDVFCSSCNNAFRESRQRHNIKLNPQSSDVISYDNHDQIAVIDQEYQAGVNLQQYKTFIFTSMDWKAERLLEPIDIEQFVGRIHRTGQVKNCRIITLLDTYMDNESRNPEGKFLKWYYKVLSDPKGFDLYGNNTPDVAFIQPIVVDGLRWKFSNMINRGVDLDKIISALNEGMKLNDTVKPYVGTANEKKKEVKTTVNNFSFPQLLELAYYYDQKTKSDEMKDCVINLIHTLCKIKGLSNNKAIIRHRRVYEQHRI